MNPLARRLAAAATLAALLTAPLAANAQPTPPTPPTSPAAQGDPNQAARRYEVLLQTRGPDAPLLYNLGVAWAEAGQHGRAIHALERAHLWAPDDEEILRDLETVRQRVRVERVTKAKNARLTQGEAEGVALFRLASSLDAPLWAWATLAAWALGWGALWLRRSKPPGGARDALGVLSASTLLLGAALALTLGAREIVLGRTQVGVILPPNPSLSDAPVATSPQRRHPDLFEGAAVRVWERRSDGWVRLGLVGGEEGWTRAEHVGMIEP